MFSLGDEFKKACDYVSSHSSSVNPDVLVRLYGYYKQATMGNCCAPKPSFFDFRSHAKWKSWSKLVDMTKVEAMELYIKTLREAVNNWDSEDANERASSHDRNWISVSTMRKETELAESMKDAFDWVKEGNLSRLKQLNVSPTNLRDDEGLSLLHWAADRGYTDIVEYLVKDIKIDVNCRDVEQQTPLHYACACGHTEIARLLIRFGADTKALDSDGNTPKDLAEIPTIVDLF